MKNYISIILTAAMTLTLAACTAAPDPAPLATPTPEPTAAPAAPTPAPAAADFYTLKSYDGSFDDGTAYYEFTQRLGYALLLDEPTAGLDKELRARLADLLRRPRLCPRYRRLPGLFPGAGRPLRGGRGGGHRVCLAHLIFL